MAKRVEQKVLNPPRAEAYTNISTIWSSRDIIESCVWDKALQTTLRDMGVAVFENWYRQTSNGERKVLCLIAEKEVPLFPKAIYSSFGENKISYQNVKKYLQRLVEKKLISKINRGFYAIPDIMFKTYIRYHPDSKRQKRQNRLDFVTFVTFLKAVSKQKMQNGINER